MVIQSKELIRYKLCKIENKNMKILNKSLLIYFIFLFTILFFFLLCLIFVHHKTNQLNKIFSNQQSDISPSLKIYRNDEYGFEFQYPTDWEIKENIYINSASKFNLIIAPSKDTYLPDPILFNFVTPEFADRSFSNLKENATKVNIYNIEAEKYEYEYEGLERISIIMPFNEYRLIIGAEKEYENTFDQILSTLRFLK